jgi:hypothetical protein
MLERGWRSPLSEKGMSGDDGGYNYDLGVVREYNEL